MQSKADILLYYISVVWVLTKGNENKYVWLKYILHAIVFKNHFKKGTNAGTVTEFSERSYVVFAAYIRRIRILKKSNLKGSVANWQTVRPHNSKWAEKKAVGQTCGIILADFVYDGPNCWTVVFLVLFSVIIAESKKYFTFSFTRRPLKK